MLNYIKRQVKEFTTGLKEGFDKGYHNGLNNKTYKHKI